MSVRRESGGTRHDGTVRPDRIIVPLGGVETSLTEVEATQLRDELTAALDAPQALTDREAMVWAAEFVRASAKAGVTAADAAGSAAMTVEVLRLIPEQSDLNDDARAMLAAMTGGGR